ncbi:hypothetical protein XELAEV_18007048mg [Xenopus laevis]|uniref:Uncharacterized protein n=1 Tax=Xenopus laevis TaxID=8355 RepID=A0A974E0S7_XENLA|nr:hypothetical protein XELAEV_18007048mg [Xenopus laevis]
MLPQRKQQQTNIKGLTKYGKFIALKPKYFCFPSFIFPASFLPPPPSHHYSSWLGSVSCDQKSCQHSTENGNRAFQTRDLRITHQKINGTGRKRWN